MKQFLILLFSSVFFLNSYAFSSPIDSTKVADTMSKMFSLVKSYNQEDCPSETVEMLSGIYKDICNLKEFSFPFSSFECVPIKDCEYAGIKLHPDLYYDNNVMISMASKDGNCLVFLDLTSIVLANLIKNPNNNGKDRILQDIASNATGKPQWSALNYIDFDIQNVFDKQVKVYAASSQFARNCNADTIYTCALSKRENIGYYKNSGSNNRQYDTISEYKTVYKILLTSKGHLPMNLYLFCKKKGDKELNRYLAEITKSVRF